MKSKTPRYLLESNEGITKSIQSKLCLSNLPLGTRVEMHNSGNELWRYIKLTTNLLQIAEKFIFTAFLWLNIFTRKMGELLITLNLFMTIALRIPTSTIINNLLTDYNSVNQSNQWTTTKFRRSFLKIFILHLQSSSSTELLNKYSPLAFSIKLSSYKSNYNTLLIT